MPDLADIKRHLLSLRVVIAGTVTLAVMFAAVIAYEYSAERLRQQHLTSVKTELNRLADLTGLAMREPLWQFSSREAESIIDSVFVNPFVLMIEVKDHAGIVFATRTRQEIVYLTTNGQTLSAKQRVSRDGADIGELQVVMSTAEYFEKLRNTRSEHLQIAFLIVSISLVIILIMLQWNFVRPVNQLVDASQQLSKGNLDDPIPAARLTELGTLASSLETTRIALIRLFDEAKDRNRALESSNTYLEQRVAERTQSLERALEDLRRAQDEIVQTEKLASLGRIVAAVAHELNTPIGNALTVATAVAEDIKQLKKEIQEPSPKRSLIKAALERFDEGVAIFVGSIQRAATLIGNFKQVATDQTSDQRRNFDLAITTAEILSTLKPVARKSSCEIVSSLESGIGCDGYPGSYGQVLTNLVINAIIHGYAEEGNGGKIYVTVQAVAPDQASLTVRDEGVGMTKDVKRRIFDPFFTTRLGHGGSGLGMNIVHGLVIKTLSGSISVKSSPGMGAEISIVFPRICPV